MTAKEMFEALGYEQTLYRNTIGIGYKTKVKPYKTIEFYCYVEDLSYYATHRVTITEHQAITQQMKELGWIE